MADLITVADARQHLNIETHDHDAELASFVSATTAVIEGEVGPVLSREVIEVQSGGPLLVCNQPPVLSLTSVVAVLTGGTSYEVADLDLDGRTGIVRRLDGGGFAGPLRVTYQAGRSDVPPHIALAARIIVGHMWDTQRGHLGPTGFGGEDDLVPGANMGFMVPRRAVELLAPDRKAPGLA